MFGTFVKDPLEGETVRERRARKAREQEGSTKSSKSSDETAVTAIRVGSESIKSPTKATKAFFKSTFRPRGPSLDDISAPQLFTPNPQLSIPSVSNLSFADTAYSEHSTHSIGWSSRKSSLNRIPNFSTRQDVRAGSPNTITEQSYSPTSSLPAERFSAIPEQPVRDTEWSFSNTSPQERQIGGAFSTGPIKTTPSPHSSVRVGSTSSRQFSRTSGSSGTNSFRTSAATSAGKSHLSRHIDEEDASVDIPSGLRSTAAFVKFATMAQNAPSRMFCNRLSEEWGDVEPDIQQEISFGKRIWALAALKRLQVQSFLESGSSRASSPDGEGRTVLNICDVLADSWYTAAEDSRSTVYCLSRSGAFPDLRQSTWGIPSNLIMHTWPGFPFLPYQPDLFDSISTISVSLMLKSAEWPIFINECVRVLKPGGVLRISVLNPILQSAGTLLRKRIERLVQKLDHSHLVTRTAMILPLWLEDVENLASVDIQTIALPAVARGKPSGRKSSQSNGKGRETPNSDRNTDGLDQLRSAVGRYFYEASYGKLMRELNSLANEGNISRLVEEEEDFDGVWWWDDPEIIEECKDRGTVFELVTYSCRKSPVGAAV